MKVEFEYDTIKIRASGKDKCIESVYLDRFKKSRTNIVRDTFNNIIGLEIARID